MLPLGVHWLVTGAIPSKVCLFLLREKNGTYVFLFGFQKLHVVTLSPMGHISVDCTLGDADALLRAPCF